MMFTMLEVTNSQPISSKERLINKILLFFKGREGMNAMFKVFNDPRSMEKLAANPKTKEYLSQPDFMEILKKIQADPNALSL